MKQFLLLASWEGIPYTICKHSCLSPSNKHNIGIGVKHKQPIVLSDQTNKEMGSHFVKLVEMPDDHGQLILIPAHVQYSRYVSLAGIMFDKI